MSTNGVNSFSQIMQSRLSENMGEEKAKQIVEQFSNTLTDKFCEEETGIEEISYDEIINFMQNNSNEQFSSDDFANLKTVCSEMEATVNSTDGKLNELEWTSWYDNNGNKIDPVHSFNNVVVGKVEFKGNEYPNEELTTPERARLQNVQNYVTDSSITTEMAQKAFEDFGIDMEGYKAYGGEFDENEINHRELFYSKESLDADGNPSQVDYIKLAKGEADGKEYIIHTTTFKNDDGNWSTTTNVYANEEAPPCPAPEPKKYTISGGSSGGSSKPSVAPDSTTTPNVPENPENPEVPENPENPEVPENPENPEVPENPENPEVPENPENPENPEVPENPSNPTPPENPKEPGDDSADLAGDDKIIEEEEPANPEEPPKNTDDNEKPKYDGEKDPAPPIEVPTPDETKKEPEPSTPEPDLPPPEIIVPEPEPPTPEPEPPTPEPEPDLDSTTEPPCDTVDGDKGKKDEGNIDAGDGGISFGDNNNNPFTTTEKAESTTPSAPSVETAPSTSETKEVIIKPDIELPEI